MQSAQDQLFVDLLHASFQAKRIVDDWIGRYNSDRPHTALDKRALDTAYFTQAETRKAA